MWLTVRNIKNNFICKSIKRDKNLVGCSVRYLIPGRVPRHTVLVVNSREKYESIAFYIDNYCLCDISCTEYRKSKITLSPSGPLNSSNISVRCAFSVSLQHFTCLGMFSIGKALL